jgi:hypothetical protein
MRIRVLIAQNSLILLPRGVCLKRTKGDILKCITYNSNISYENIEKLSNVIIKCNKLGNGKDVAECIKDSNQQLTSCISRAGGDYTFCKKYLDPDDPDSCKNVLQSSLGMCF